MTEAARAEAARVEETPAAPTPPASETHEVSAPVGAPGVHAFASCPPEHTV